MVDAVNDLHLRSQFAVDLLTKNDAIASKNITEKKSFSIFDWVKSIFSFGAAKSSIERTKSETAKTLVSDTNELYKNLRDLANNPTKTSSTFELSKDSEKLNIEIKRPDAQSGKISVTITGRDGRQELEVPFKLQELIRRFENDIVSNPELYGRENAQDVMKNSISRNLDENGNAKLDSAELGGQARELCINAICAATGADPTSFNDVPLDLMYRMGMTAVDGRYKDDKEAFDYYFAFSKEMGLYNQTNSPEVNEMITHFENLQKSGKPEDIKVKISYTAPAELEEPKKESEKGPLKTTEKEVRNLVADLISDSESWKSDVKSAKANATHMRMVFAKHLNTIADLLIKPELVLNVEPLIVEPLNKFLDSIKEFKTEDTGEKLKQLMHDPNTLDLPEFKDLDPDVKAQLKKTIDGIPKDPNSTFFLFNKLAFLGKLTLMTAFVPDDALTKVYGQMEEVLGKGTEMFQDTMNVYLMKICDEIDKTLGVVKGKERFVDMDPENTDDCLKVQEMLLEHVNFMKNPQIEMLCKADSALADEIKQFKESSAEKREELAPDLVHKLLTHPKLSVLNGYKTDTVELMKLEENAINDTKDTSVLYLTLKNHLDGTAYNKDIAKFLSLCDPVKLDETKKFFADPETGKNSIDDLVKQLSTELKNALQINATLENKKLVDCSDEELTKLIKYRDVTENAALNKLIKEKKGLNDKLAMLNMSEENSRLLAIGQPKKFNAEDVKIETFISDIREAMERAPYIANSEPSRFVKVVNTEKPVSEMTAEEKKNKLSDMAADSFSMNSGYGRFIRNTLARYFVSVDTKDRNHMIASLVRYSKGSDSYGAKLGALIKGVGPIMQKVLQAIPVPEPSSDTDPQSKQILADLKKALADTKCNLAPIPDKVVLAQLQEMVEKSNGAVKSIEVVKSLGSASVGQAFLVKVYSDQSPFVEDCVVKMIKPDIKNRAEREKDIFLGVAREYKDGMEQTFKGQLDSILAEMDLREESENTKKANCYNNTPYSKVKSATLNGKVHSTNSVMMQNLAKGQTVSNYLNGITKKLDAITEPNIVMQEVEKTDPVTGKTFKVKEPVMKTIYNSSEAINEPAFKHVDTLQDYISKRNELNAIYKELVECQKSLTDMTRVWVTQALYDGGFYHGDLHSGNIMYDSSTREMTMIDFGNTTQMTSDEQKNIFKTMAALMFKKPERFYSSFEALLTPEGKAKFNENRAAIEDVVKEVIALGTMDDVGAMLGVCINKISNMGIEIPPALFKFSQCQLRLNNSIEQVNDMIKKVAATMSRMAGNPVGGTKQYYPLDFAGRCLYYTRKNIGKQSLVDADTIQTELDQINMLRNELDNDGNFSSVPGYMSDEPNYHFYPEVQRIMAEHLDNVKKGKPDTDEYNVCIAPYFNRLRREIEMYEFDPSFVNVQAVADKLDEILRADLYAYEQNFKDTIIKSSTEMPSFMKVMNEVGKSKPISTATKVGISATFDAILTMISANNT